MNKSIVFGVALASLAIGSGLTFLTSENDPIASAVVVGQSDTHIPEISHLSGKADIALNTDSIDNTLLKINAALELLNGRLVALEAQSAVAIDNTESQVPIGSHVNAEEIEAQDHTAQEQKMLDFEARLFEEATDKEWSDSMVQTFESDLKNQELVGATISFASCGATICKLELELSPDIPVSEYLQRMSVHRSWSGATEFSADTEGRIQLFIAREGASL